VVGAAAGHPHVAMMAGSPQAAASDSRVP
jgi:hypothetical protein